VKLPASRRASKGGRARGKAAQRSGAQRPGAKKAPSAPRERGARTSPSNGVTPDELRELIEISRAVGKDPDLVQGGGGNTSVKTADGRHMYVKASGTALGEMDDRSGWALLDLAACRAVVTQPVAALPPAEREAEVLRLLQATVVRPSGARPSVEASLHAILGRVVIHTHPVGLNALLAARGSREAVRDVIGTAFGEPLYVPYVDPGYTLARRVDRDIEAYRKAHGRAPAVVLLENHGLFVADDGAARCLEISNAITDAGRVWIGGGRINPMDPPLVVASSAGAAPDQEEVLVRGALGKGGAAAGLVRRDDSEVAREFCGKQGSLELASKGAFTPDQIVYCRTRPLVLDGASESWPRKVAAYRAAEGLDPRVVLRPAGKKGGGISAVYYAAPDAPQLRVVAEVYRSALTALLHAPRAGGPRFLGREEAAFIEGWEVERFRAALLTGNSARLRGKIAFVTGAASGLGKGIARGLTEAGATVFALDINPQALETVRGEMPRGKYLPVPGDVTDEASVKAAFAAVASSAGGLDILVNAAGIAPAFPLVDFPVATWRKTLEINLTGYFLCAREAARLLLAQGTGGAIVNLTSKSGLEASKENSAYNATKAGEIHLMRGWALELGKAGIRVNCVAPGNVFKGSQIWNEEYIRACARKKGIRPEEVIPYYTSLSPLGREIEPEDIANAVIFLVSDEARNVTGQTLVVDGGQVMVR
jgi:NAD(P)-dependent dehydrogenase (short-subunit alcohol dehydrogenase family)/rhamnose utilization protein RhaD (predicted bifunctional aldolase and dehydrogenase)